MSNNATGEWEADERLVCWVAWPGARTYGPGLTAAEVAARHDRYLRSGYWQGGSDSYHYIRVAPDAIPSAAWAAAHPNTAAGVDPWGKPHATP